jgi:hypothetical protein
MAGWKTKATKGLRAARGDEGGLVTTEWVAALGFVIIAAAALITYNFQTWQGLVNDWIIALPALL